MNRDSVAYSEFSYAFHLNYDNCWHLLIRFSFIKKDAILFINIKRSNNIKTFDGISLFSRLLYIRAY